MRCVPSCCSSISFGACLTGTRSAAVSLVSGISKCCTLRVVPSIKAVAGCIFGAALATYTTILSSPLLAAVVGFVAGAAIMTCAARYGICNKPNPNVNSDEELHATADELPVAGSRQDHAAGAHASPSQRRTRLELRQPPAEQDREHTTAPLPHQSSGAAHSRSQSPNHDADAK
jgi:hypothetical protein